MRHTTTFLAALRSFLGRPTLVPAAGALYVALQTALAVMRGNTPRFYDERDYLAIGRSVAEGRGFSLHGGPTAFRPPGQPLFIALVQSLGGTSMAALVAAQALLLALGAVLVARLTRPTLGRPDLANLAGLWWLAHPGIAYATGTAYPVALTTASLGVGLVLSARALDARSSLDASAGGVALGVAALTTPYFLPLVPGVALLAAWRRSFRVAAIVAFVGLAPTAAWVARNAVVLGSPTIGTHGGYNLALGADDRATPRSGNAFEPLPPRETLPDDELARDAARREAALAWMREHPARWAGLATARAVATLDSTGKPSTAGAPRGTASLALGAVLSAVATLGVLGLWLHRRRTLSILTAIAFACVVASAAATVVKPRFRFPVDPLLGVFAVLALSGLRHERHPRTFRSVTDRRALT
jgi:hypothetical protein